MTQPEAQTPMARRIIGFTLFPLASLVTPLLLLPVIARTVGENGWSSVIAGQAIGTFAFSLIVWGWNVDGPVRAARADRDEVRRIYAESVRTRLLLLGVIVPLASVLSAVIAAPGHRVDAIALCVSIAVAGLSPAWVAIGLGKPVLLALFDTGPRVVGTILAVPVILLTQQVYWYGIIMLATTFLGLVIFGRHLGAPSPFAGSTLRSTVRELARQQHTAGINVSGNAYAMTPVPIANALNPAASVAGFASADSLYRFGLFSVSALANSLQSWVVSDGPGSPRQYTALKAHAVLGVTGGAFLTVAGPFASELLFGAAVRADMLTCGFYGLAFLGVACAAPLIRNVLIPAGLQRVVLRWTMISAVLGVAGMLAFAASGLVAQVALAMAISDGVLALGILPAALAVLREHAQKTHDAPERA